MEKVRILIRGKKVNDKILLVRNSELVIQDVDDVNNSFTMEECTFKKHRIPNSDDILLQH
jgi:hypothetical protein